MYENSSYNLYAIKNPLKYNDSLGLFSFFGGVELNLEVSFSAELCIMAPFFGNPFLKICTNVSNRITAGTCCDGYELRGYTQTEFSATLGVKYEANFNFFSINVEPNLSVGHVDQCPYYTEFKISGIAQLTLSGFGLEVGISIPAKSKNDWADISYSTAWQLNPTVYVAGGIKGEGSSIKPI